MEQFNALYRQIEAFLNDDAYMTNGVGGGIHPGEPLFALAIQAKKELQHSGVLPKPPQHNELLAEKLDGLVHQSGGLLNDEVRDLLSQASAALRFE